MSVSKSAQLAVTRLAASSKLSSLADLVRAKSERSMLAVDVSGSMEAGLSTGERAIDALRKVVEGLREVNPVPVVAFGLQDYSTGEYVEVDIIDVVPEPAGGTPMHLAIDFARAKGANHLIVVTDGIADSQSATLTAARNFGGKIDVFYVGNGGPGADFAKKLAESTGGVANITDLLNPKMLQSKIMGLLPEGLPEGI